MINLFNKTDDFIGSEKIKAFPLVCSKYLSSWTGLGRSGHDGSQSFGPIWHVSGPEMVFRRNDIMILHHFCWRSSEITLFYQKTLMFDQKSSKNQENMSKYKFSLFTQVFFSSRRRHTRLPLVSWARRCV